MYRESWYYPEGVSINDPHIAGYPVICECEDCGGDIEQGHEYIDYDGQSICLDCIEEADDEVARECSECGEYEYGGKWIMGNYVCSACYERMRKVAGD